MHLAQREVVELEGQFGRDVGVGASSIGSAMARPTLRPPAFVRAAVGRLHDAGAAAGADEELVSGGSLPFAVLRHQLAEGAGLLVVVGIARQRRQRGLSPRVAAGLGLRDHEGGVFFAAKPGAAEHHHGVLDAVGLLLQVGLEQLQLKADAAGFAAQQELGVGEGQA
jgi:hypothetical protein